MVHRRGKKHDDEDVDKAGRPKDIPRGVALTKEEGDRLGKAARGQKMLRDEDTFTEAIAREDERDKSLRAAKATVDAGKETAEAQAQAQAQGPAQPIGVLQEDFRGLDVTGKPVVFLAGTPVTEEIAQQLGLTRDSPQVQQADIVAEGTAIAAGSLALGPLGSLSSRVGNFLSRSRAAGKIAQSSKAKEVLKSPGQVKSSVGKLGKRSIFLMSFFGFGASKLTTDLLLSGAKNIEGDANQLGERLTKIPETTSNGFKLDEDNNPSLYTHAMGLADIKEAEEGLNDAAEALKVSSIGNFFLKLTSTHKGAVQAVETQLTEVGAAESKIFKQIANPSEAYLNTLEFWADVDLLEDEE